MSWRDKIFEEEPKKVPPPSPKVQIQEQKPSVYHPLPYIPDQSVPIGTDGAAYQKLLSKTDFDQTTEGIALAKYMKPLEGLALDESTKLKAALAQANAQKELSAPSLTTVFTSLKATLDAEAQKFAQFSSTVKARDVDGKLQQIEAKKKQIDQLNGEILNLTTDAGTAQQKIDHAQAEFSSALSKRKSELDQQAAHYASLLQ